MKYVNRSTFLPISVQTFSYLAYDAAATAMAVAAAVILVLPLVDLRVASIVVIIVVLSVSQLIGSRSRGSVVLIRVRHRHFIILPFLGVIKLKNQRYILARAATWVRGLM